MLKLAWEPIGEPKANGFCNYGYEQPWAEVTAFHVHRLLGFLNTPFVSGRKVDIAREILPVASPRIARQIVGGTYKEMCVVSKCSFCELANTFCKRDGMFDASVAWWVPRHLFLHTWWPNFMPFSTSRIQEWRNVSFNNRSYCDKIRRENEPYTQDRYYLDLFDFAVVDYIMYHFDTKHYVIDDDSSASGLTVRLDHGRAFCSHEQDKTEIFLSPLLQCCTLRRTTYNNLLQFKDSLKFEKELKALLASDPLSPRLNPKYYRAFHRRIKSLFRVLQRCADANGGLDAVLV